jgi:hypothetical protein
MNSWQQGKQRELYSQHMSRTASRDTSSEEFIASRLREITSRRRGRSLSQVIGELREFMNGWWNYFGITESFNRLKPLAHLIRRNLRAFVKSNGSISHCRMPTLHHSDLCSPRSDSARSAEPPDTDPYVRWCGRGEL